MSATPRFLTRYLSPSSSLSSSELSPGTPPDARPRRAAIIFLEAAAAIRLAEARGDVSRESRSGPSIEARALEEATTSTKGMGPSPDSRGWAKRRSAVMPAACGEGGGFWF